MPHGRPKKEIETAQLTEQEVYNVFEFAKSMYNVYPNVFTPQLANERMKDITMNPLKATQEGIDSALLNPKSSEQELIGFNEYFELTNMLFKRMILYLGNMLSFDIQYVCINAETEDYKKPSYKSDIKKVYNFLDKFDIKKEFKTVLRELVRRESFYSVLRTDGEKYTLQELPQQYCLTTGKFEFGNLFDFNAYWLIQPSVDIDMYPPVFKRMFKEVFNNDKTTHYKPSASIDKRDGSYVYWVQTSPEDGFWQFKLNPDLATNVPFLSPLFSDVVLKPLMLKLQTNINVLKAQKVMVGLIPMLNNVKSGSVKDQIAVSADTLGKFLGLLKQGLSDSIKVGGMPFTDIKEIGFDSANSNIMEEYSKTTSASSGLNSRLLFSTDKMSSVESQLSVNVDEYLMTYIYPYFANFLDYHINKLTNKYKFKFTLVGTEFDTNKQKRLDTAISVADKGIVCYQLFSSALGLLPQDLLRMMDETKASGFLEKLSPMLNINTMASDTKGGRPKVSDNDMKEGTESTRENGSNIGRGGKL